MTTGDETKASRLLISLKQVGFVFNAIKTPAARFAILFICKILVFGLIYWTIFLIRPDSFNFSSGFNSKPLSGFLDEFYELDDPSALGAFDFQAALNKFNGEALELKLKFQKSQLLEKEKTAKEKAFDELYQNLDADRVKEIDFYDKKNIQPLELESEGIKKSWLQVTTRLEKGLRCAP